MKKELSPKQILALPCPTCGAAPGERCELSTGQPRDNPHVDRQKIEATGGTEHSQLLVCAITAQGWPQQELSSSAERSLLGSTAPISVHKFPQKKHSISRKI